MVAQRLRTALLSAALLLSGGMASYLHASLNQQPARVQACVLSPNAFLAARDIGDFTTFVDQQFHQPPFTGRAGGQPLPFMTDFRGARIRGFIATLALRGPERRAEDARAHALYYKVGRWPLVPLEGHVVRAHGGALEVYQTNWSFSSAAGASAWLAALRASRGGDAEMSYYQIAVSLGDESFAYHSHPLDGDPSQERAIGIDVRRGATVSMLRVQGGSAVDIAVALPLARKVLSDITRACAAS